MPLGCVEQNIVRASGRKVNLKVVVLIIQKVDFNYLKELPITIMKQKLLTLSHLIVPHSKIWSFFALKRSRVVQDRTVEEGCLNNDPQAARVIVQDMHCGRRVMFNGRAIPQGVDAISQHLLVQNRPLT